MPRAKRVSDEIYNERRRMRRALARAERQGRITEAGAKKVRAEIAKTYTGRIKPKQQLEVATRAVQAAARVRTTLQQEARTLRNFRSDKVMQISMRAAYKKRGASKRIADVFNEVAEREGFEVRASAKDAKALMRVFWASTQKLWQTGEYDEQGRAKYAKPAERIDLIKKRLGVDTIEEAMRMVFAQNAESLQRFQDTGYGAAEDSTARYPDFLHWVVYVGA